MDNEPYVGVITFEVRIPASLIDGDGFAGYQEVEETVADQAEYQLQALIVGFKAAARG